VVSLVQLRINVGRGGTWFDKNRNNISGSREKRRKIAGQHDIPLTLVPRPYIISGASRNEPSFSLTQYQR
jgi:hypothetical protein